MDRGGVGEQLGSRAVRSTAPPSWAGGSGRSPAAEESGWWRPASSAACSAGPTVPLRTPTTHAAHCTSCARASGTDRRVMPGGAEVTAWTARARRSSESAADTAAAHPSLRARAASSSSARCRAASASSAVLPRCTAAAWRSAATDGSSHPSRSARTTHPAGLRTSRRSTAATASATRSAPWRSNSWPATAGAIPRAVSSPRTLPSAAPGCCSSSSGTAGLVLFCPSSRCPADGDTATASPFRGHGGRATGQPRSRSGDAALACAGAGVAVNRSRQADGSSTYRDTA